MEDKKGRYKTHDKKLVYIEILERTYGSLF